MLHLARARANHFEDLANQDSRWSDGMASCRLAFVSLATATGSRVTEALAMALAERDVNTIFCVAGDANRGLLHRAASRCGIRLVPAGHAAGAVAMAEGYARVTGGLGACAIDGGSRVLMLVGDRGAGASVGARRFEVRSARSVLIQLAAALCHVGRGRGPAVLEIPVHVQRTKLEAPAPCPGLRASRSMIVDPDPLVVRHATCLLAGAARPALLAGRGAIEDSSALLALAEQLGAPVVTTMGAKGLGHGNPLVSGVAGVFGDADAAEVLRRADVICVFGSRLDEWTTTGGGLLADADDVIQIDWDAEALAVDDHVTVPVLGDVASTLRRLLTLLAAAPLRRAAWWTRWEPPAVVTTCGCRAGVHAPHAMRALDSALGKDRIVVVDGDQLAEAGPRVLTAFAPGQLIAVFDSDALCVAVGAACGAGGRGVTAVIGDPALADLASAARLQLPLTLFVMSDRNLVGLADAAGVPVHRVATCGELDVLPALLAGTRGPLVIDVATLSGKASC